MQMYIIFKNNIECLKTIIKKEQVNRNVKKLIEY